MLILLSPYWMGMTALSDYLYAEDNQEYVERMELYLLGVRDAIALLSFLKI